MTIEYIETGVLHREDNLTALSKLPGESVDLIYLDPPFFSNRIYEVIWGDEAEVRSFEDRWEGGMQVYITWMRERVLQMYRVLRPTGSLYMHCDPHASHYLKIMLDSIFGTSSFRSEIVWKRTTAHNSARRYGPVHDLILFYSKDPKVWTWNQQYQAYSPGYIASKYRYVDAGDRERYRLSDMTGAGIRTGDSGKPWKGFDPTSIGRHWQPPSYCYWKYTEMTGKDLAKLPLIARLDELERVGLVYWPKKADSRPQHKRYLADMPGVALQDVWTDIDAINARAAERLGYPTQKPESLLSRLVSASSNRGDTILDPFCGCGTTVSVAEQLGRRWIGVDISPTAVNIMRNRLGRISSARDFKVLGMPDTEESLRELKPFEFQNWVIQQFVGTHSPKKSGDMGIDGYSFMVGHPIQVKRSDRVGRNVVDNFETAMRRGAHEVGYIVAFSFTRGAKEEVARARWEDHLEISLLTVAELLRPRLPDRIPELGQVAELPLPPSRPAEARPSAEELIRSDLAG